MDNDQRYTAVCSKDSRFDGTFYTAVRTTGLGATGLASSLRYSSRQVGRLLVSEVGAGPPALARAQRARTARILVETSALALGDVAFAAGFTSIRQFNATMLEVYDIAPSALRERARRRDGGVGACPSGELRLRLPFRAPIDLGRMFGFLAARAIPGLEVATATSYARTISLPNGPGFLSLMPVPDGSWVDCALVLSDLRDVTVSYGDIALALGKTLLAARAVGLANGRNPISIIVPCHRVIGADGSLTGYGWGVDSKEWFLRHEGVPLASDAQPTLFG